MSLLFLFKKQINKNHQHHQHQHQCYYYSGYHSSAQTTLLVGISCNDKKDEKGRILLERRRMRVKRILSQILEA